MVTFRCQGCGHEVQVKDELAGRKVKCLKCGQVGAIPLSESAVLDLLMSPPDAADRSVPEGPRLLGSTRKPFAASASPVHLAPARPRADDGLRRPPQEPTKPCPHCDHPNPRTATKCRRCGKVLIERAAGEVLQLDADLIHFVGPRDVALRTMIEAMTACGGTIEPNVPPGWTIEARWAHPSNPQGARVRASLQACPDGSIRIRVAGGFANVLVKDGIPHKRAGEVLHAFAGHFRQSRVRQ
jgi:ribosomal protein S27E